MSKVDLLIKLAVQKDQRTNNGEVSQRSVKHTFGILSDNFKKVFFTNLVFTLIFALPLLFFAFVWPMLSKNYFFTSGDYNFIGQVGIGYPGIVNTMSEGYAVLFKHYFTMYLPILCACIVPFFLGLSGMFHCCRGYMWGENVRPVKSFFRGIKKLWLPFLVTGVVVAIFICGVMYGTVWHVSLMKAGLATAGSWVLFIALIVLTVLFVAVLIFLLPMFACYRFNIGDAIKNSAILAIVSWPKAIFTSAFTVGLFALSLAGTVWSILVCILMFFIGFVFLSGLWTAYAQKAFGNFIIPQYQSLGDAGTRPIVTAKKGVNPYKLAKAARKKAAGTDAGKAGAIRAQKEAAKKNPNPYKKKR